MQKQLHKPALLIIDMQNDFGTPDSRLYSSCSAEIIPAVNDLSAAARKAGTPIIWVSQQHRRQLVDFGREGDISPLHCVEGTPGEELMDGLVVGPDDFKVIKRRYSGFYCTDLDLLLRCLGCDTVILSGIATDGCVQSTAIDAHARDYYVRVVCDATATGNDLAHEAALVAMSRIQPDVVITKEQAVEQFAAGS